MMNNNMMNNNNKWNSFLEVGMFRFDILVNVLFFIIIIMVLMMIMFILIELFVIIDVNDLMLEFVDFILR